MGHPQVCEWSLKLPITIVKTTCSGFFKTKFQKIENYTFFLAHVLKRLRRVCTRQTNQWCGKKFGIGKLALFRLIEFTTEKHFTRSFWHLQTAKSHSFLSEFSWRIYCFICIPVTICSFLSVSSRIALLNLCIFLLLLIFHNLVKMA